MAWSTVFSLAVLAAAVVAGWSFLLRRQLTSSVGVEKEGLTTEINVLSSEILALQSQLDHFVSSEQFQYVREKKKECLSTFEGCKIELAAAEKKLEKAQRDVAEKEGKQQQLKGNRTEEEEHVRNLATIF